VSCHRTGDVERSPPHTASRLWENISDARGPHATSYPLVQRSFSSTLLIISLRSCLISFGSSTRARVWPTSSHYAPASQSALSSRRCCTPLYIDAPDGGRGVVTTVVAASRVGSGAPSRRSRPTPQRGAH
jgi:hypothetical protein